MKLVNINNKLNQDAIEILKETIRKVEAGEIIDVSIAWVTKDNAIGGAGSNGSNAILMWASLEHSARSFYHDFINPGEDS